MKSSLCQEEESVLLCDQKTSARADSTTVATKHFSLTSRLQQKRINASFESARKMASTISQNSNRKWCDTFGGESSFVMAPPPKTSHQQTRQKYNVSVKSELPNPAYVTQTTARTMSQL